MDWGLGLGSLEVEVLAPAGWCDQNLELLGSLVA